MKRGEDTKRFQNNKVHGRENAVRKIFKTSGFETLLLILISAGTVISGILVCMTSIGVGLPLILLGPIVMTEG